MGGLQANSGGVSRVGACLSHRFESGRKRVRDRPVLLQKPAPRDGQRLSFIYSEASAVSGSAHLVTTALQAALRRAPFSRAKPSPYIPRDGAAPILKLVFWRSAKVAITFAAKLPVRAFHQTTLPPYVSVP